MPNRVGGPAVVFKRSEASFRMFVTPDAKKSGGEVEFEFKSKDQMETFVRRMNREVYPTLSSTPFQALARAMFGPEATPTVRVDGVRRHTASLTREQFRALTDEAKVEKALRKTPGALGGDGDAAAQAKRLAKMARFVLNTRDANGVSAFHLFDMNPRRGDAPKTNGKVRSVDVENLVIATGRRNFGVF